LSLKRLILGAAWLAGAIVACTHVEDAAPPPGFTAGGAGGAGMGEGGAGNGAGEGGDGQAGSPVSSSGAPATVELGLWPTFASDGEGDGTDGEAVLAAVSALSAGSSTLPLYVTWSDLSTASGGLIPSALTSLDALTEPYRERGKKAALCLGIVDRALPAWPFTDALDSDAATSAVERTIDELLARYGDVLSHLCFGYEVDRYLAGATVDESVRFSQLLERAVAHVRAAKLPGLAVGIAVTLEAVASSALVLDLVPLKLGHEVVATYDPLREDGSLKRPETAGDELAAALDQLPEVEGGRLPLALFEAGYPADTSIDSSEQAQRLFFEALFSTLDARTEELSFIGLFGLGDRSTATCDAEARSYGDAAHRAARSLARCSIGLRAAAATPAGQRPRLAWPLAVSALSRYR
jgi:hypothetical protein